MLSHAVAFERDAVGDVDDPVEDGVGDCWLADHDGGNKPAKIDDAAPTGAERSSRLTSEDIELFSSLLLDETMNDDGNYYLTLTPEEAARLRELGYLAKGTGSGTVSNFVCGGRFHITPPWLG